MHISLFILAVWVVYPIQPHFQRSMYESRTGNFTKAETGDGCFGQHCGKPMQLDARKGKEKCVGRVDRKM